MIFLSSVSYQCHRNFRKKHSNVSTTCLNDFKKSSSALVVNDKSSKRASVSASVQAPLRWSEEIQGDQDDANTAEWSSTEKLALENKVEQMRLHLW